LTILCSLLKTIIYSTTVKNVSLHLIFLLSGSFHYFTKKTNLQAVFLSLP